MKLTTLYNKRKRAISPVIAVILLIGLAVAASAAIFLVVLPLFESSSTLELNDAYVRYDGPWTKAVEDGHGYGIGTLIVSNVGTGTIEIVSFKIYHSILVTGPWTEISDTLGDTSASNPITLDPITSTFKRIDIQFPLPDENDDLAVYYKMVVETSGGSTIDSTDFPDIVDPEEMKLSADRPSIGSVTLGTIRRTHTVSPSSVSDNLGGEVKSVVFEVLPIGGGSPTTKTITEPLWRWSWNTRNMSSPLGGSEGLSNGNYSMNITVFDYAGLSRSITSLVSFTIDNDYVSPTITALYPEAVFAEVGESFEVKANIIDTGSQDSDVNEAYLYYKLQNETSYTSVGMIEGLGFNWSASIPIDARALEVNLTYIVLAIDADANDGNITVPNLVADDTRKPNIYHTPSSDLTFNDGASPEALELKNIEIYAEVEDAGIVDTSTVYLYVRKSNDLEANATISGENLPSDWVKLDTPTTINKVAGKENTWNFTWLIPYSYLNVTIHGLDYYFTANDTYRDNMQNDSLPFHGTKDSPHHIIVNDLTPPTFIGLAESNFASSWTESTDLAITLNVYDNDPTFGRIVGSDLNTYSTGDVRIYYRDYDGQPNFVEYNDTVHISGNSSNGDLTQWFGTIPGSIFDLDLSPRVDFYFEMYDQSSTIQSAHSLPAKTRYPNGTGYISVEVKAAGEPNIIYSVGDTSLKNNNETVSILLNNTAPGSQSIADAHLTGMQLDIYSSDWDFLNGKPNLTKVIFTENYVGDSYNSTVGTPQPWGGNGTTIVFENYGLVQDDGGYNRIELSFTNDSGGSIDMHNMILNITFTAKNADSGTNVSDQWIGLVATPGVEPPSTISPALLYNGRRYITNWLVTPGYSYGSSGLGWDSELDEPWASPSEYSRADIASGTVFPYDGFGVTSGYGTLTTNTWEMVPNNDGYRMNIDGMMGSVSYTYVWFYAVIEFSGSIPSPTYMYLGSDDEAICYINGQVAGQYGSPRGYGETQFQVTSLLKGNGEKNFILFGVHEDGGAYRGGLAFSETFQVKIFTGPPPAPLSPPLMAIGSSSVPNTLLLEISMNENPIQLANSRLMTIRRETISIETEKSF